MRSRMIETLAPNASKQNVRSRTVTTMQLTLGLPDLAGVAPLTTTTTTTSSRDLSPRFERGALAFYRGYDDRVHPCQVGEAIATGNGLSYTIRSGFGFRLTLPDERLLSGWEDDFPYLYLIDYQAFKLFSTIYEHNPEEEAEFDRDDFFDEYGTREEDLLSLLDC